MTEDMGMDDKEEAGVEDGAQEPSEEGEKVIASQQPEEDDRYPERNIEEQEAMLQEYNEQEFGDDVAVVDSTIEQIVERARDVSDKLKSELKGSVLLEVEDTDKKYHFNWTSTDFKFSQEEAKSDCRICLTKRHLAQIARGKLNPQIAMLSDKIKVDGKASLAVYFFNVVAPVPRG